MRGTNLDVAMKPAALVLRAAAPLLAICLHGCASLSESECRDENWYAIGFDDGYEGNEASRLADHGESCAKYAITPDAGQYEVGRRDGLAHYCTVTRGFEVGRSGLAYGGGCPAGADREFLRGHELGRRYYPLDQALLRVDGDLALYRSQLGASNLDDAQLQRLYGRIRDLELQRSRLESDRRQLDWERQKL
jgi:hypothetical protein